MNRESPEANEPVPEFSQESIPEISPEELQEMIDQLPILRGMLDERELELSRMKSEHVPNAFEIIRLQQEIRELQEEISGREEFVPNAKGGQTMPEGILMPSRDESEPTEYAGREPEFPNKSVVVTDEGKEVIIVGYLIDKGLYVIAGKAKPLFRISPGRFRPKESSRPKPEFFTPQEPPPTPVGGNDRYSRWECNAPISQSRS